MRTFRSKLGGFFPRVGADVVQLAAKTRQQLLDRPDVQKLREVLWSPNQQTHHVNDWNQIVPSEVDKTTVYDTLADTLRDLPDEGFKLFPWVVREFKKGTNPNARGTLVGISRRNYQHARDILTNAIKWLVWSREHNKPTPDMMAKDFALPQMQDWVYEMNAQNSQEDWVDSQTVYTFDDGWTMAKVGPQDVAKEGQIMGHCVGGYVGEAKMGRIFSLRDPKGGPHVTIEFNDDPTDSSRADIIQAQGKENRQPIEEYQRKIEKWYDHLRDQGCDVQNKEEREPEDVWVEHHQGPFYLDEPDDVLDYHRTMLDPYDKYEFCYDEEPEYDAYDNTITYMNPRDLVPRENGGFPSLAAEFAQQVLRGGEHGDIDSFVQGLWMAVRHHTEINYYARQDWKPIWQQCIEAVKQVAQAAIPKPKPMKQPTLFEPSDYNQQPQMDVTLQAMIRYMEQLTNAPDQWEVPEMVSVRNPNYGQPGESYWLQDGGGNFVKQPGTRTKHLYFPPEGSGTNFNTYFNQIGMPGLTMRGTFARLISKLAATSYPNAPSCPYDGTELDIHFHGGVECPTCGAEFELGKNDRLLPSDKTIEEDAATWPNTIPNDWHIAMSPASVVCAWCGRVQQPDGTFAPGTPIDPVSHGICPDCAAKMRAESETNTNTNTNKTSGWTTYCPQCNQPLGSNEWRCEFCRKMHDNPGNDGFDIGKATPEWLRMPTHGELPQTNDYRFSMAATDKIWDYPFLYEPESGWLAWGAPNGYHDPIYEQLRGHGEPIPTEPMHGRYDVDNDSVRFYSPVFNRMPADYQEKHRALVLRNAPGRPQEPLSGDATENQDDDPWIPVMGL